MAGTSPAMTKERVSQIQHQPRRVLQAFLHPHQKCHRLAAVDDAVVVGEREIHHRTDLDLAGDRHRPLLDLVHAENSGLRRVQNGRRQERAIDAAVGNGEGSARQILELEPPVARAPAILGDLLLDLGEAQPIGVAVGTPQGLVVPIVRDADRLSFAGIEKAIGELGKKARDGKLAMEDLTGGTFTISNGGVYGSLMSTPILNAPQSGILGMHKIQERPMVVGGKIEVRPMMYLALSYDHRIVDGREAVTFLVRVKENLEDPARIVLDL